MNDNIYEEEGFIIRKAKIDDNLEEIAELIYDTDESIYSYWFDMDVEKAKKILPPLIKEEGFYLNYKSMYVAIDKKTNKIAGFVTIIDPGTNLDYNYDKIREESEASRFIVDNYILNLIKEIKELGFPYISNVCVNREYRGKKIGKLMFNKVLKEKEKIYYRFLLDTLQDNPSALKIYKEHGFEIIDTYLDLGYGKFENVPAYTMEKNTQKHK